MNTQLVTATGYETSRMIFLDPVPGSIPESKPAITYKRIPIETVYDDGSTGPLILSTEEVYSYGVGENTNIETGKTNGFVMPLVLYSRNGPTPLEKAFVDTFNNIVDKCKEHLLENKDTLDLYDLEMNDLKKLNPIYQKKEKGKVVEGASPTLYAKLIVSKKQGEKIVTVFFHAETGEAINPLDYLGKHCRAIAAIKFESIFIGGGNKISLQVKLYECQLTPIDNGFKSLLQKRPVSNSRVLNENNSKSTNPMALLDDDDDDDDAGSLIGMDEKKNDEDYEAQVEDTIKTIPKKVVKKIIKKVAAK